MIVLIFDILVFVLGIYTLKNFSKGFISILIAEICIPSTVRFQLGSFDVNIFDLLLIFLIVSFLINRPYKSISMPSNIKLFFLVQVVSTFVLIFFSSAVVPYSYQIFSFFKGFLFQTYIFLFMGFYASKALNMQSVNKVFINISICIGVYGICTYILKYNPYIDILSVLYTGEESIFSYFMEEVRGGLEGRVYGTMSHPLQWGQFWNIFIAYLLLFKNSLNKRLLLTVVIIGVVNIVLCGSRTAIIAFIITISFYYFALGFRKICAILLTGYICVIFLLSVLPRNIQNNGIVLYLQSAVFFWDSSYSEKAGIVGSSASMREEQLNTAIDIMQENPIGGLGYNYQYYAAEKEISTGLLGFESIVFKLLVEQGIISLILFFFVLYLLWRQMNKTNRGLYNKWLVNGFFATFIISILFTGIQGSSFIFFISFLFLYINCHNSIHYYES